MNEEQALLNEAFRVVGTLNETYYDQTGEDENMPFVLRTDGQGGWIAIEFWGITIWRSDTEERNYCEETNEYDPLMGYIIDAASKLTKVFQKVDFSVMVDGNND